MFITIFIHNILNIYSDIINNGFPSHQPQQEEKMEKIWKDDPFKQQMGSRRPAH